MKMGTRGPHFGGSLFSLDTGPDLTKFCNHGLAAFYGSSSSRLRSVSRACSSPLLASVGELVTIMLLAGSTIDVDSNIYGSIRAGRARFGFRGKRRNGVP